VKTIDVVGFAGSNQSVDPLLLPEAVGAMAVDMEPGRGNFRPLKARVTVATVPSSPQRLSIWRMGRDVVNDADYWLSSSNVLNYTLGFGTDSTERTYYTGEASPRWTNNNIGLTGGAPYPQTYRELSVPAPTVAATVALNTDGTGTTAQRFYLHTFVNDLGWESAPSPVSATLSCKPGAIVDITNLPAAPAGNYGITARRIYRTQPEDSSADGADFFFLREIAIGSTSTQDDARALGDLLSTDGWIPPPATSFGIVALWGSMFALLYDKNLLISEPGAPYAYPIRYWKGLKDKPVGQVVFGQNLLVLTAGRPVLFQGTDPAGLQDVPFNVGFSCASARGIVGFEHGAAWPSNEGLAYSGSETLVTEGLLTPDQWKALNPSTMIAGRWGRFYVCSYDSGGGVLKGFMIDPLRPAEGITYLSAGFNACHYDELADRLYVLEGGNVRRFAAGPSVLTGTFTAKRFAQAVPRNYGWAQVVAKGYPVTLKVTSRGVNSDGTPRTNTQTRTVANADPIRLAAGFLADDIQPELTSAFEITTARLALSVQDFGGG
jgi:hypothetical protein